MNVVDTAMPLYQVMVRSDYDDTLDAIEQAIYSIPPLSGPIRGDLKVECVKQGEMFKVTVWRL